MFTKEGLPLDHAAFGAAVTTAGADDDGPARRIDCRPPPLLSAPTIRPSKGPMYEAPQPSSLTVGPCQGSLIDDDDDEIVDYFGGSSSSAPRTTSPATAMTSSSLRNVREQSVPSLPSFYPLEKSAIFVPQASAADIASRVADVLKARSIVATYDGENAKVDCVSKDHVEFRIRLYRGRGEYSHGIIIEVQRRWGFDLSFSQDVYAILDAAEGKTNIDAPEQDTPIFYEDTEACDEDGMTSLKIISDILCPKGINPVAAAEVQDLALESLASLTSLEKMGHSAVLCSKDLVSSEALEDLRRAILSNVGPSAPHETQRSMLLCLEILVNVAALCPSQSRKVLEQNDQLIKLVANIENYRVNPRAADLSCVILKNLCNSRSTEDNFMMTAQCKQRLLPALMEALTFGREHHADIEKHSQQCLQWVI